MPAVRRLLIAEIHGLAGRERELEALLGELAGGARGEDGCLTYRALRGEETGEFVLLAAWRDEAALRAHYAGAPYRRYRMAVTELLARPSDVTVHHVAESVHAIDPNPPDPGLLG
jgi:quinol monooxygenase YgiN